MKNNRNFVHDISEHSAAENHDEYCEYPGLVWLGGYVAVADSDHGHDGPVVADYILGLPVGDLVPHLILISRQPDHLNGWVWKSKGGKGIKRNMGLDKNRIIRGKLREKIVLKYFTRIFQEFISMIYFLKEFNCKSITL